MSGVLREGVPSDANHADDAVVSPIRAGWLLLAVIGAGVGVAACTVPRETSSPTPVSSMTVAETPSPASSTTAEPSGAAPGPYRQIALEMPNGAMRDGRYYGDGEVGVVLTHMGRIGDSQDDWAAFAEDLAAAGYQVVTFNHDSQFVWVQVVAAVDYLRDIGGASTVVAAGASIGAMASLRAAQEPGSGVNAVVWLAGVQFGSGYAFNEEDVRAVVCPILFASGTDDEYGAAGDTERLSDWAETAELLLVDSSLHGTDILREGGPAANELRRAGLDFIDRVAATPGGPCS